MKKLLVVLLGLVFGFGVISSQQTIDWEKERAWKVKIEMCLIEMGKYSMALEVSSISIGDTIIAIPEKVKERGKKFYVMFRDSLIELIKNAPPLPK